MSSQEMNLSVQNGFPVKDFTQGRDNKALDMQEVVATWYSRGLELAIGVEATYTQLFYEFLNHGNHPEMCYQLTLDSLSIPWQFDTFLITDKNETVEI